MEQRRDHGRQESGPLINEKIPHRTMQVISSDGKMLGVLSRDEALLRARAEHLDLVIISEREGEAPVAKIMDYGKASYAKKKQMAAAKKKQTVIQVKEIQIGPKIGNHDLETKVNNAIRFLEDGKHVKVVMSFRGREIAMSETRGTELYAKIDALIAQAPVGKHVQKEKDQRSGHDQKSHVWSRVYYCK